MGKEHEVTRVALDSLGGKLNQAESELSGTGRKRKRQPGERQSSQLFKRLDTKKGGLDKEYESAYNRS